MGGNQRSITYVLRKQSKQCLTLKLQVNFYYGRSFCQWVYQLLLQKCCITNNHNISVEYNNRLSLHVYTLAWGEPTDLGWDQLGWLYSTCSSCSFWGQLSAWACSSQGGGRDTRAQATKSKFISSFWLCHKSINILPVKASHIAKSIVKGQGHLYLQRETIKSWGRGHGHGEG